MWGGGIYSENLNKAIAKFVPLNTDAALIRKLRKDITLCYLKYGATPDEYFLLGFKEMNSSQRSSFITDKIKDVTCMSTTSLDKFNDELTHKYHFYQRNKFFFKRKVWLISSSTTIDEFTEILKKYGRLFLKPLGGSYGNGAHIVEWSDEYDAITEFATDSKSGEWIAEELIEQSEEMAKWNPTSVNTVRIPSIMVHGKSNILGPFFRTGRNGSVIDNAGGGGILAAIDETTGIIISDGFSEEGIYYQIHPESGLKYKGWQVPKWEELKQLTQKVHSNMPDHKYIAFDFALTDNGWVLIEGNWGQFLWQYAMGKGLKSQFLQLMRAPN